MTDQGFVPTPAPITDWMVSKLFAESPNPDDTVLLPGCGTGNFAAAIERCCSHRGHTPPDIYAVEPNDERAEQFQDKFCDTTDPERPEIPKKCARELEYTYPPDWTPSDDPVVMDVTFTQTDFLLDPPRQQFDYIIANPPFVQYNHLDKAKREQYADKFETATGRFNLYAPFIEQMCNHLSEGGELVCIIPDTFLFSKNAAFRKRIREETIHGLRPLPENVFPNHSVRTSVLTLTADHSIGLNGSFAITTWYYTTDIEEILKGVGVDEDVLDNKLANYTDRYDRLRTTLSGRRQTKGKEGGYNCQVDPTIDETQPDLGEWA